MKITPTNLKGSVCVPSSKSMGHREIICAALAAGESLIKNVSISDDIEATAACLSALGVMIQANIDEENKRINYYIKGSGKVKAPTSVLDCHESGSTLRFMIPIALLSEAEVTFIGRGKLVTRPLQAYYDIFDKQAIA